MSSTALQDLTYLDMLAPDVSTGRVRAARYIELPEHDIPVLPSTRVQVIISRGAGILFAGGPFEMTTVIKPGNSIVLAPGVPAAVERQHACGHLIWLSVSPTGKQPLAPVTRSYDCELPNPADHAGIDHLPLIAGLAADGINISYWSFGTGTPAGSVDGPALVIPSGAGVGIHGSATGLASLANLHGLYVSQDEQVHVRAPLPTGCYIIGL